MADVASDLKTWSATASSNSPAGATAVGTGLDDNLRELQKVVRQDLATKGADIASAATTDIGAVAGLMHDITGTTTITSLGTVSAGIWKILKFEGALTLTHNATSLILPGAANIACADGDVGIFISEGSGNWRCLGFMRANGSHLVLGTEAASTSGTAITFTGIPPWAREITIMLEGVGTNGTSNLLVQIGDSGGLESTGYVSAANDSGSSATSTAGFILTSNLAASDVCDGSFTIRLKDAANFTWVGCGNLADSSSGCNFSAGSKSLSAVLDRISLTSVSGDTFDAGSVNIIYS